MRWPGTIVPEAPPGSPGAIGGAGFLCLLAALAMATIILAVVTPPFQAADEHRHFFRAYQLAEGVLLPESQRPGAPEGRTVQKLHASIGGMLPRAIDELLLATEADRLRFHTGERIRASALFAALSVKVVDGDRVFYRFPHTTVYPAYIYLPQVLGIVVARSVTDRVLLHFYAARIANGLAALALLAVALRAAPGAWPLALSFWLLPLVQFQAASLSLDATINAASLALAATCLAGASSHPGGAASRALLLAILACKLAYAPFALLIAADRSLTIPKRIAAIGLAVLPLLVWMVLVRKLVVPVRTDLDLDTGRQLALLLADPIRAAGILISDWGAQAGFYVRSMVGILGWLDRPLPTAQVAAAYALLVAGAWLSVPQARTSLLMLAAVLLALAGSAGLTQLALLLTYTQVGSDSVAGVQGRYFLPLLPPALLAARSLAGRLPRSALAATLFYAALAGSWAFTVAAVVRAYYLG